MVGSYCVHRVELDTEPDMILEHAGAPRDNHKYIARVNVKDPSNPKRKWRYFYSQGAYQAYLHREAKYGDKVQLANGRVGTVGVDVAAPAASKGGKVRVVRPTRPSKVEEGQQAARRLLGVTAPDRATIATGNTSANRIFDEHRAFQERKLAGKPLGAPFVTKALPRKVEGSLPGTSRTLGEVKTTGTAQPGNTLSSDIRAKIEANKQAGAQKRKEAEENATKKKKPAASSQKATLTTASKDDKSKSKGSGGGRGGGGGSGKGSGKGSGSGRGGGSTRSKKESGDSDNATSFGSVSKLPKLKGDHDPDRDMRAVGASDHDSTNCVAYDLRRRGFEVTPSLKANAGDIKALASSYKGARVAKETNYNRLIAKLSKLNRGCRGMMQFGGRMVMWSVEKQGVVFRDCTNGKLLNQNRMHEKGPFQLIRTDNCEPNTNILRSVRARS